MIMPTFLRTDLQNALFSEGVIMTPIMIHKNPEICVLQNFLSEDECDELIEQSRDKLKPSNVYSGIEGEIISEVRTSSGMFFQRGETNLVEKIEKRLSHIFQFPVEYGEGIQILRYKEGQEYRPHFDYFDPSYKTSEPVLARGGNRVGTIIMYLNTCPSGGTTAFPDLGLEIVPQKGNALFFSYDRPSPETKTLHGGLPVLSGEKWIATKWVREREFK